MASWDEEKKLKEALADVTRHKAPVSASRVGSITKLAIKNAKFYKHVVYHVEKFAKSCPSAHKISALYIIDSICRGSKAKLGSQDVYTARFAKNLATTFDFLLACSDNDIPKIQRVVGLWHQQQLFQPDVLSSLERIISNPNAPDVNVLANSGSATPTPLSLSGSGVGALLPTQHLQSPQQLSAADQLLSNIFSSINSSGEGNRKKEPVRDPRLRNSGGNDTTALNQVAYGSNALISNQNPVAAYTAPTHNVIPQNTFPQNPMPPSTAPQNAPHVVDAKPKKESSTWFNYDSDEDDERRREKLLQTQQKLREEMINPGVDRSYVQPPTTNDLQQINKPINVSNMPTQAIPPPQVHYSPQGALQQAQVASNYNQQPFVQNTQQAQPYQPFVNAQPQPQQPAWQQDNQPNTMQYQNQQAHVQPNHEFGHSRGPPEQPSEQLYYSTVVWVGNLADSITEQDLFQAFEVFGKIVDIKYYRDKIMAFVTFEERPAAEQAKQQMKGVALNGKQIKTGWAPGPRQTKQGFNFTDGTSTTPPQSKPPNKQHFNNKRPSLTNNSNNNSFNDPNASGFNSNPNVLARGGYANDNNNNNTNNNLNNNDNAPVNQIPVNTAALNDFYSEGNDHSNAATGRKRYRNEYERNNNNNNNNDFSNNSRSSNDYDLPRKRRDYSGSRDTTSRERDRSSRDRDRRGRSSSSSSSSYDHDHDRSSSSRRRSDSSRGGSRSRGDRSSSSRNSSSSSSGFRESFTEDRNSSSKHHHHHHHHHDDSNDHYNNNHHNHHHHDHHDANRSRSNNADHYRNNDDRVQSSEY